MEKGGGLFQKYKKYFTIHHTHYCNNTLGGVNYSMVDEMCACVRQSVCVLAEQTSWEQSEETPLSPAPYGLPV